MATYLRALMLAALPLAFAWPGAATAADPVSLDFFCTSDTGGCEVWQDILKGFEAQNPDIHVNVNHAPYRAELESLPAQLAAGQGPDLAVVTNLGGLQKYYLDLTPYVDAKYFEDNYGPTLPWLRGNDQTGKQIYGFQQSLTINGPFVNTTLFEQAGVPLPDAKATWEDWAAATQKVAQATSTPAAMAMDRSGHRFASLAISYGAQMIGDDGRPVIDDGFRKAAELMVQWHKDKIMPFSLWGAIGGATYAEDFDDFKNGQVVLNYAGSWAIGRMQKEVGDTFDWKAVPTPCGTSSCTAMPGGGAIVAFNTSKHPAEVGKVISFMAQAENVGKVLAATAELPANQSLVKTGIKYENLTPAQSDALNAFNSVIPNIAPAAYKFQGYAYEIPYMNAIATRLSQVTNGELTLDDAHNTIKDDVNWAIDSATK
jgi:alpha-1,4-digalacturonate transport system substrate-binding protein